MKNGARHEGQCRERVEQVWRGGVRPGMPVCLSGSMWGVWKRSDDRPREQANPTLGVEHNPEPERLRRRQGSARMDLENPRNLVLVLVSASVIAAIVFGVIIYEMREPAAPVAIPGPALSPVR